jgi:hypothetical protein
MSTARTLYAHKAKVGLLLTLLKSIRALFR